MTYKTIVIDDAPKTKKLALAIERCANEYTAKGWKLVTFSITYANKAILLFQVIEALQDESDDLKGIAERLMCNEASDY